MATFTSVNGRAITIDTFPAKGCCPECGRKGRLVKNAKDFWFHTCPVHGDWSRPLYTEQVARAIDWQAEAEANEKEEA